MVSSISSHRPTARRHGYPFFDDSLAGRNDFRVFRRQPDSTELGRRLLRSLESGHPLRGTMNGSVIPSRCLRHALRNWESSETIRRAPSLKQRDEDMVHAPWRHGEPVNYNGEVPTWPLENPTVCWNIRVSGGTRPRHIRNWGVDVGSENPTGADNQQETASPSDVLNPNWVVGFVDGEGCFCVSVHRSSMMRRHGGWQFQPAFHVYQHKDHRVVLEGMISFFGCGRLRPKGPKSNVLTFAVEGLRDLEAACCRSSNSTL